jgi:hypothetical protein
MGVRRLFVMISLMGAIGYGCTARSESEAAQAREKSPLADTLVAIFHEMKAAALSDRANDLVSLLDSAEARKLRRVCGHYSLPGLRQYLETRFAGWPDPDTLTLEDLTVQPPYARIALAGSAEAVGHQDDRIRFTFLLFRQVSQNWRLSAVSTLEKDRFDRYGTRLGFHETELPSQFRFPRLF